MSSYTHLFKVFPRKCGEILDDSYRLDKRPEKDREVTHMIALAVAGIGMTYERLFASDLTGDKKEAKYKKSYEKFNDSLKTKFLDFAELYRENTWFYGEWRGKPSEWENQVTYHYKRLEDHPKNIDEPLTVKNFLQHLRNALAHSNIAFLPKDSNNKSGQNEINQIVFLQKSSSLQRWMKSYGSYVLMHYKAVQEKR